MSSLALEASSLRTIAQVSPLFVAGSSQCVKLSLQVVRCDKRSLTDGRRLLVAHEQWSIKIRISSTRSRCVSAVSVREEESPIALLTHIDRLESRPRVRERFIPHTRERPVPWDFSDSQTSHLVADKGRSAAAAEGASAPAEIRNCRSKL